MDKTKLKEKISYLLRELYMDVYYMGSGNIAHNRPPALQEIYALGRLLYEEGLFDVENKYVREKFGLPPKSENS